MVSREIISKVPHRRHLIWKQFDFDHNSVNVAPQVILPDFFRGESRVGLTSFSLRRNISFSFFFINSFLGWKDLFKSKKDQISYIFLEGDVERFALQDVSSPDLGDWLKGQSNWWAPTLTRALTKKIIFNWIICNWTTHSTIFSEKNHPRP